jgi:hypothetical protein
MSDFEVIKKNTRLYIVQGGVEIYTPPDFLRPFLISREPLQKLAQRLSEIPYIDAVLEFESQYNKNVDPDTKL